MCNLCMENIVVDVVGGGGVVVFVLPFLFPVRILCKSRRVEMM